MWHGQAKATLVLLLLGGLAVLLTWRVKWVVSEVGFQPGADRFVPFVAGANARPEVSTDVVSSLNSPLYALIGGLLGALFIDIGRLLALRRARAGRLAIYISATVCQVVLILDAVRVGAYDWFLYFLGVFHLADLSTNPFFSEAPLMHPGFPVFGCVAVLTFVFLCTASCLVTTMRDQVKALDSPG